MPDNCKSRLSHPDAGSGAREKPSADTLSALASATILRTDERGNIEIVVDVQTPDSLCK